MSIRWDQYPQNIHECHAIDKYDGVLEKLNASAANVENFGRQLAVSEGYGHNLRAQANLYTEIFPSNRKENTSLLYGKHPNCCPSLRSFYHLPIFTGPLWTPHNEGLTQWTAHCTDVDTTSILPNLTVLTTVFI